MTVYQPGDRIAERFLVHRPLGDSTYQCLEGDNSYVLRRVDAPVDAWVAVEPHPHVVRCFGMVDDLAIVEWIYGATLLAYTPLDEQQALEWAMDVCNGLMHVGDLVPRNILIDQYGVARITDLVPGTPSTQLLHRLLPDEDLPPTLKKTLEWLLKRYHEHYDERHLPDAAARYYDNLGCIYHEVNRMQKALPQFNHALTLEPGWSIPYRHRSKVYRDMGLFEAALMDINQAAELDPHDARVYNDCGELHNAIGQHETALVEFERALRLEPTFVQALNNRGNTYSALGQHERALVDLNKAVALEPQNAKVYANRGSTYYALGHYEAALNDYDYALMLDPWLVPAYTNRGVVHAVLGNDESALGDHQRAIDMAPDFAEAYYNLGVFLANRDQPDAALDYLQQAADRGFMFAVNAIDQLKQDME